MIPAFDFTGKVAVVTGSSRGIGAGIVRAFAAAGASCIVNFVDDPAGRNRAEADAVAATAGNCRVLQCDVSNHEQVAAMMREIAATHGGIDLLVNNAGVLRDHSIKKVTPAEWDLVLGTNLTGAFNCTQHAAPLLRAGGRVVNIASVAAQLGLFGQASYAASKAGIIALTKVAARELAKQQVTVNAVAPGVVETEMTRDLPPESRRWFSENVPLARTGTISDIVSAVLFLCSPFASYITGHTLHVNGGLFMA